MLFSGSGIECQAREPGLEQAGESCRQANSIECKTHVKSKRLGELSRQKGCRCRRRFDPRGWAHATVDQDDWVDGKSICELMRG